MKAPFRRSARNDGTRGTVRNTTPEKMIPLGLAVVPVFLPSLPSLGLQSLHSLFLVELGERYCPPPRCFCVELEVTCIKAEGTDQMAPLPSPGQGDFCHPELGHPSLDNPFRDRSGRRKCSLSDLDQGRDGGGSLCLASG
jgi:hypothetical protein